MISLCQDYVGDGITWQVNEGCDQYTLTVCRLSLSRVATFIGFFRCIMFSGTLRLRRTAVLCHVLDSTILLSFSSSERTITTEEVEKDKKSKCS